MSCECVCVLRCFVVRPSHHSLMWKKLPYLSKCRNQRSVMTLQRPIMAHLHVAMTACQQTLVTHVNGSVEFVCLWVWLYVCFAPLWSCFSGLLRLSAVQTVLNDFPPDLVAAAGQQPGHIHTINSTLPCLKKQAALWLTSKHTCSSDEPYEDSSRAPYTVVLKETH